MVQFNINNSKVRQINAHGDNIEVNAPHRKSLLSRFLTLYGILGTTICIITGTVGWIGCSRDTRCVVFRT